MNYYQVPQGPGRYISVPWYFPVQHPIYPNYSVDPNHPHWIPAPPYANAPIVNGRQSENDGNDAESNVDDDRSGGAAYPPPGVGLPAASTMQQQPVYQMVPPFSNVYVGSLPSGVSVQGFVNSPIPFPHPYPTMAASSELNTPPNSGRGGSGNRSGGSGGKSGSGGKITSEKGSNNNAADASYNAVASLPPQDSNAANDPSTPSLPPAIAPPPPPHPQANILPFGAMPYSYSYFPQAGHPPPPPHMTSAQHAAGSPLYLPHPSLPMYHTTIYNSAAAAAVFSTDNGVPHPAVSVPVSMPPPSDMTTSHENESVAASTFKAVDGADGAAAATATPIDDQYKNSNLLVDSPPYQPENHKNGSMGGNFVAENVPTSAVASSTLSQIENVSSSSALGAIQDDIACATDKEKPSSIQGGHTINDVVPLSVEKGSESTLFAEKVEQMEVKVEKTTFVLNESMNPKDEGAETTTRGKEPLSSSNSESLINTKTLLSNTEGVENVADVESRSSEIGSNDSKSTSPESVNGKSNSSESANSSGFESGISKLSLTADKDEISEENSPPQSAATRTWASLFKESSSTSDKSKASSVIVSRLPNEPANNTTALFVTQNVDNIANSAIAGHTSSLNGVPSAQPSIKSPNYKYSSMPSVSLADDTALPKIGELLKNFKLDHRAVNFEPRGLDNRSNFCYVNAILQALLACPPFYNLMKCISHNLHSSKTKLASKQHIPIIDSIVQFVDEFRLISQKARRDKVRKMDAVPYQEIQPGKSFEPSSVYNVLSVIQNNSVFAMGQQEDAQEFLTCLLNGLNDEMVELIQLADGTNNGMNPRKMTQPVKMTTVKNNKKLSNGDIASEVNAPDDSDSEWKQVHSKIKPHRANNLALTRTPLSEIFRGQMRSRVQKVGDSATNNIEPFFTLHLNIEKASSVKEALELLVGRDALEGVTSSRTNQEVDAWQQQTLEELPFVLLLHLKYFDFKHHTCTKIMKSIEFPIDLKLDLKLISPQSALRMKTANSKSRQYKLFAVVYHDGKEASKGHFVTDVFHIGYGGWIRYDDSRVCTVSETDVLKPKLPRVPYLLYYRRCDTIAALMQPPFEKRQWWG